MTQKKHKNVRALIDLSSKINIIHLTYTTKLGLCARKVNISAHKIDESHLDIFEMVIADCLIKDKLKSFQFF